MKKGSHYGKQVMSARLAMHAHTCKGWFTTGLPCTWVEVREEAVDRAAATMGGVLGKEEGRAAETAPACLGEAPSGGRCLLVACTSCLPVHIQPKRL